LPLSLFSNRAIAIADVAGALFTATMFGATTYLPLYAQVILKATPTQAGQMLTPMLVFWPVCSTIAGFTLRRVNFRPLVIGGLGLAALANLFLAAELGPESPLW